MINVIVFFLKVLIVGSFLGVLFMFWKTYNTQKWNRLLSIKQDESPIRELRRRSYKLNYGLMTSFIVVMFISLSSPNDVVKTVSPNLKAQVENCCAYDVNDTRSLMENFNDESNEVFIVFVNSLSEIEESNVLLDDMVFYDYYNYSVNVEKLVINEGTVFDLEMVATAEYSIQATSDTTEYQALLSTNLVENMSSSLFSDNPALECDNPVVFIPNMYYLVIGGYVDEEDARQASDRRLQDGAYIYTINAVLLEGYDPNLSMIEQSIEIQTIIADYMQYLVD